MDGTATAGSDYTATSGDLTFGQGEQYKTINVQILGEGAAAAAAVVDLFEELGVLAR